MLDLFVNKAGVAYPVIGSVPGVWAIDQLADGAVGVFQSDGTLCNGATGTVAFVGDYLQIGMKQVGGGVKQSVRLYRPATLKETAYVAPAGTAKSLGAAAATGNNGDKGSLNLPSTLIAGETVSFSIRDLDKERHDETSIEVYSFPVRSGDVLTGTGANNIVAKAAAEVNANANSVVTAAAVVVGSDNDGILFTSKVTGKNFAVMIMQGLFQDADILEYSFINGEKDTAIDTGVVQYEGGQGTPGQIAGVPDDNREGEHEASTRDGQTHTQVLGKYMYSVPSQVEAGITYDQLQLKHVSHMSDELMRENNPKQTLKVAGQTADIAKVKAILTAWTSGAADYTIPV